MELDRNHVSPGPAGSSNPASRTPKATKGQEAKSNQRTGFTVTPFHMSPIINNDAALQRKPVGTAMGKAPPARSSLFLAAAGRLTAEAVGERFLPAATAEKSEQLIPSACSAQAQQVEKAQQSGSLSKARHCYCDLQKYATVNLCVYIYIYTPLHSGIIENNCKSICSCLISLIHLMEGLACFLLDFWPKDTKACC